MNACKQHRRQLALLSVQALDEREKAAALAHVEHCGDCRAYWEQLQRVAGVLRADAERSIEAIHTPVFARPALRRPVLTLPRAVAFAVGIFVVCAAVVLFREPRHEPPVTPTVVSQPAPISVPTIADSRRLVKDLDALMETPENHRGRDFVFSVGTRYEGP